MMDSVEVQPRPNALRRLYNWTISKASGPHAWWALAAFSFAEASFFPIPPDVMLAPMALADRRRAFQLAGWCTLFSVLGGLFGYAIGSLLYDSVGHWLIQLYGYGNKIQSFSAAYERNSWLILFQGFTPIPFKLVTISAGFAHLFLPKFVLFCAITRGARFTLEATFLYWLGEPVRDFMEKWLEVVSVVFLLLVVAGFLIARYAF